MSIIMGAVLKLPPIPEIHAEQPAKHLRLRKRSRILAAAFNGLFWLCAAYDVAMVLTALFYQGHNLIFGPEGGNLDFPARTTLPPGYVYWSDVTLRFRIGAVFAAGTQFVPATMLMLYLRGLFRLYARGIVFAEENALAFKRMGLWLILYAVTPFLSVKFLTLINCVIDRNWYHETELYALGLGSILFVIAEVMQAGREIEQERDEFV